MERRKRQRRNTGGSVSNSHREAAKQQAERDAEQRARARQVAGMLADVRALEDELERLKGEQGVDNSKQIGILEQILKQKQQDQGRRLAKQEKDSELAKQRRVMAGMVSGPAPPPHDPPMRGPGFAKPRPPQSLKVPPPPVDELVTPHETEPQPESKVQ